VLEHIERLIGQSRGELQHQGGERGVATQRLELRQMLDRTLGALAREPQPVVLVHARGALGLDAERAHLAQALDQLGKIAAGRRIGGLPQPRQRALAATDTDLEQLIQCLALPIGQSVGEPTP